MPRLALGSVLAAALLTVAVSCSKSAGSQDSPKPATGGAPEVIAPPPGERMGAREAEGEGAEGAANPGPSEAFKLKPDEGHLVIEVPPGAEAGKETIARVIVTPTPKYKINFEFPTSLKLQSPDGVTLAKAELKAGGPAKVQGDAEQFEEKQLAFAVKLTPVAGSHTISGTFKFAVCDKDQCLAKNEVIAIQVAAK